MKRRDFLRTAGLALGAFGAPQALAQSPAIQWKMVTTWAKDAPVFSSGAAFLARLIGAMSGGRIEVQVHSANELVPALESFDAVSQGKAELGHSAAYYWKHKSEAAQFFAAIPFGLTAQEMNAWLYQGGGLELWQELYAPYGLIPTAAGTAGMQMGGWFNKEIQTPDDLKGLKMRMPGLGSEVLKRAGAVPLSLPGSELVNALQSGALDAVEWVGPYNDLALGLHKAAKYYYYPGWHEPGATLECVINKKAFEALPKDLQAIVLNACRVTHQQLLAEFTARNNAALQTLINEHKVNLRRFPDEVLAALKALSEQVLTELVAKDPLFKKVHESYRPFREQAIAWDNLAERAYLNARGDS